MFSKLRTRLTVIFAALAIIPLIAVTAVFAARSYSQLFATSIHDQSVLAERFSVAIQNAIFSSIDNLTFINETFGIKQLTLDQQRDLLNDLLSKGQEYNQIALLNGQGMELARVSRLGVVSDAELANRSQDPLFQDAFATRDTRFSDVHFDVQTGEPLLSIAIPYLDLRTGSPNYIVIADFRLRTTWDLINTLEQQLGGVASPSIFVTDQVGQVIAHANASVVLQHTVYHPPAQNGQGVNLDGEPAIITTQPLVLGNKQFTLVGEQPLSEALRPAADTILSITVISVVALLIAVVLVVAIVAQVVNPIERLSQTAQVIQGGNLKARAVVKGRDEIAKLSQSFNDMTGRLENSIMTLEDQVAERVRDIALASDVSRDVTRELDSALLLQNVVDRTAAVFNLYHVSVFLYNAKENTLYLQRGTGETGEKMLAAGKKFGLSDKGLVPQAAQKGEPVLSNDVAQSSDHLPNPLLPATRAEFAIPMLFRDQLIGVLDLQARTINRFHEEDINILKTLAEQIATAIRNAQLFEEVQRALREAERANSVKSAFLASMSHELRTPLNAVINFTRFVVEGDIGPVNEQQVELLKEVIGSAKHLQNLINDVLDMSKIESGSLTLFVEENVNLNGILKKVMTTGTALTNGKPIRLELDAPDALPLIRADQQRILQILLNMMSNACKFTEEGTIKVSARTEDDEVILSVEDSGTGIAPEDQPIVFEAFKQTESGLRQGGGTGLGMPISKSLAEAHGGRVWLESTLNKGSTFYLALPIKSETLVSVVLT